MHMTDNTILLTGGTSGIGRGLAEAFHARGNTVIISGRRQALLDEVTAANPGKRSVRVDVNDKAALAGFAQAVQRDFPKLNVLVNNAGIMKPEDLKGGPGYVDTAEQTIATNLLGPIRLTAALLPHLLAQPRAAIMLVSSGLAFVPMAMTPTYSATKAALHSYAMSLRHQLAGTSAQVIELAPPYVQTELMGAHQSTDERAMPLAEFLDEVMRILTEHPDAPEVIVGRCEPLRYAAERGKMAETFEAINAMQH